MKSYLIYLAAFVLSLMQIGCSSDGGSNGDAAKKIQEKSCLQAKLPKADLVDVLLQIKNIQSPTEISQPVRFGSQLCKEYMIQIAAVLSFEFYDKFKDEKMLEAWINYGQFENLFSWIFINKTCSLVEVNDDLILNIQTCKGKVAL
jgi:hypothetical protein